MGKFKKDHPTFVPTVPPLYQWILDESKKRNISILRRSHSFSGGMKTTGRTGGSVGGGDRRRHLRGVRLDGNLPRGGRQPMNRKLRRPGPSECRSRRLKYALSTPKMVSPSWASMSLASW